MTEKERGSVEILVHTTAPSRGRDDAHYRALASAYLLFEPVQSSSLSDNNAKSQLSAPEVHVAGRSSNSPLGSTSQGARRGRGTVTDENIYDVSQSQDQAPSRAPVGLSSADISLDSSQVSFSSVLDNLSSPALLRYERTVKNPPPSATQETDCLGAENESSWKTPPSVIPDSQSPYNLLIPEYSSPTRILELYLQHFNTSGAVSVANDASGASQGHEASSINLFLDSSQPQASSPPEMTPPHAPFGIDESPQIIRDTPYAQHHRRSTSPRLIRNTTPSPKKAASSPGTRSGFARANRRHMPPPPPPTNQIIPPPQTSPQRKRRRVEALPLTTTSPPQRKPAKRPLPPRITPTEIHPPPPATSSWGPKAPPPLITPSLQLLAAQLDLPRRYRPRAQTRALRPLERGYWAVDTAAWPPPLPDRAWAALAAYLSRGSAGWGVWAVRPARPASACDGVALGEAPAHRRAFRVYCWGAVAGHVYLLLYLVSQRRVKETGAQWVDGGGEVVVRML